MAVTFGGLVSGLDTTSLIDGLVSAEKTPATALGTAQTQMTTRKTTIASLVTRLSALSTTVSGMDTSAELRAVKGSSSDASRVELAVSNAAAAGQHQISVTQLASAQTSRSKGFTSDTAGIAGAGTISIKVGSDAPVDVTWTASSSLTDIAAGINSMTRSASASVLFDGTNYRLIVNGGSTGAANAVTFTDNSNLLSMETVVPAQDAIVTLDTMTISRPTNTLADVLPGVTMTLRSATPTGQSATTLSVTNDDDGLKTKLQSLIDNYNAVSSFVQGQLTYSGVKKGQDTLFGDSGVQALQRTLSQIVGASYSDGTTTSTLKDLGISVDRTGQLSLDATKLKTATAADSKILERVLFGAGTDGFAGALKTMVKAQTNSVDGVFTLETNSLTSRIKAYGDKITRINDSADRLGARLRVQFTALEDSMAKFQSQSSFLTNMAASFSSG